MAWSAVTLSKDEVRLVHWFPISILIYHIDMGDRNSGPECLMSSLLLVQIQCPSAVSIRCAVTTSQFDYVFEFVDSPLKPKLSCYGF